MTRLVLGVLALAACAPAPKESALANTSEPGRSVAGAGQPASSGGAAPAAGSAAQGPIPEPVSAAANPAPAGRADSSAEAQGRRILSTAFVRVGPDNLLTVGLRDGRSLVLRDVAMRPNDFCGSAMTGGGKDRGFCASYAEVATARPGGIDPPAQPDLAAPNPLPPQG